MIRRPPRSPLFPYTPLSRSQTRMRAGGAPTVAPAGGSERVRNACAHAPVWTSRSAVAASSPRAARRHRPVRDVVSIVPPRSVLLRATRRRRRTASSCRCPRAPECGSGTHIGTSRRGRRGFRWGGRTGDDPRDFPREGLDGVLERGALVLRRFDAGGRGDEASGVLAPGGRPAVQELETHP